MTFEELKALGEPAHVCGHTFEYYKPLKATPGSYDVIGIELSYGHRSWLSIPDTIRLRDALNELFPPEKQNDV